MIFINQTILFNESHATSNSWATRSDETIEYWRDSTKLRTTERARCVRFEKQMRGTLFLFLYLLLCSIVTSCLMRACESECVSMCVHVCVRVSVHAFMSLAWMREEYWEEGMAEDLPNQFVCVCDVSAIDWTTISQHLHFNWQRNRKQTIDKN